MICLNNTISPADIGLFSEIAADHSSLSLNYGYKLQYLCNHD